MPTVSVYKTELFRRIGLPEDYTDDQFDHLCFEFGVELDDITSDREMVIRAKGEGCKEAEGLSDEVVYKVDVPANRYDILCLEGLVRALRIFLGTEKMPKYVLTTPAERQRITVTPHTKDVRPFVVGAILRDVTFDQQAYDSFLDLQDKLHQNVCRKRTLVAIGTHDLDTVTGPFTYDAQPRKDIVFQPLAETDTYDVDALFEYYKQKPSCKLKPYLAITEGHARHPVIRDAKDTVLSLPPIINGEHSKITLNTKNVLIECTATDYTKACIVLNMMVTMFSQYCKTPFEVEPVDVVYAGENDRVDTTPHLDNYECVVGVDYINRGIGIDIKPADMVALLAKMQLQAEHDPTLKGEDKDDSVAVSDVDVASSSSSTTVAGSSNGFVNQAAYGGGPAGALRVTVPPTRPDVLHPIDVLEDVAIGYGYNNIVKTIPSCHTEGRQLPLNKFSDLLRGACAGAGYTEVLTWALCSRDENFSKMRVEDDGTIAVKVSNPKTLEFQCVRSSLLSGLIKTLASNKGFIQLPVRIFELSDVCLLVDPAANAAAQASNDAAAVFSDTGARNERRCAALYCGVSSGFEEIHGVVDRLMTMCDVVFQSSSEEAHPSRKSYITKPSKHPSFFPGRCADIIVRIPAVAAADAITTTTDGVTSTIPAVVGVPARTVVVGQFGILHPDVLANFDIRYPCSALEFNVETFL